MKKARIFATLAAVALSTLPIAAMAQDIGVGANVSAAAGASTGVTLSGVTDLVTNLLSSVTGLLGGTGLLSGLGL